MQICCSPKEKYGQFASSAKSPREPEKSINSTTFVVREIREKRIRRRSFRLFFFTSSSKRENDQQLDSAGNASDRVLLHQFKEEFLGGSNSLKTMLFSRHRRHSSPEKEVAPARDKKNEEMTKNSGPSVGLFCFFPSSQPKPV